MATVTVRQATGLQVQSWTKQASSASTGAPSFGSQAAVCRSGFKTRAQRMQLRDLPGKSVCFGLSGASHKARRSAVQCAVEEPSQSAEKVHEGVVHGSRRSPLGLLAQGAVAWLPLVLAMAAHAHGHETNIGEVHVDPSMDIFSTWHLSESFIKHFYVAFICIFSFGCVYFGSLKDPFYEGEESGYRADGGNGTGHWFYDVKEQDEENSREELARQMLALQKAQEQEVARRVQEQLITASSSSPSEPSRETVSSL